MKAPVRYSRGRMIFTSRLPRRAFEAWTAAEGRPVVERVASKLGFALLGRRRAARRRLWRQLTTAACAASIVRDVQRELDAYLQRLDPIVYAHGLPRVGVDLRRLIVVPRSFPNAQAFRNLRTALRGHPAFDALDSDPVRDWLLMTIVSGIDHAVTEPRPSPRHPLAAGSHWLLVGVNEHFECGVPLDGPGWPGHYHLLELTSEPLTRSVRKAAEQGIARLEASLPSLTRIRRNEILRSASISIEHLLANRRARAV
jgi:hypothetical protein